jgi:hypothetical protein
VTELSEFVQFESPGVIPNGHQIGSLLLMMFAAACVASGTAVPVASNTTTGVPVGTTSIKVEVSVGAIVVSVGTTTAVGTDVSADVTVVFVGAAVMGEVVGVLAGAIDVDKAEVSAGTDVFAGTTGVGATEVSSGAEMSSGATEVAAAGEVGAIGVLLSACAIVIHTELATSTNIVTKDNHPLRNRLFIVPILSSKI